MEEQLANHQNGNIGMKSGNGINSAKLKMPEGREREKRRFEVIVQQSCVSGNCYEHVDTGYAAKPHLADREEERKEKENGVVLRLLHGNTL